MSEVGEALLAGLGSYFGQRGKMEEDKRERARKMEDEQRQKRMALDMLREELGIRKEAASKDVKDWVPGEGGTMIGLNAQGEQVATRQMTAEEIKARDLEMRGREADVTGKETEAQLKQRFGEREAEARLGQAEAATAASRASARASEAGTEFSLERLAQTREEGKAPLVNEYRAELNNMLRLVEGMGDVEKGLAQSELMQLQTLIQRIEESDAPRSEKRRKIADLMLDYGVKIRQLAPQVLPRGGRASGIAGVTAPAATVAPPRAQ